MRTVVSTNTEHRNPCRSKKSRGKGITLARSRSGHVPYVELTPKDKIILSFAIARSFWEFYGSELATARWSSQDIWFMPRAKCNQTSNDLELKAFISFPFGQDAAAPDEFLEVDDLTHLCPRILSLGIILLEIGLGKRLNCYHLPPTETSGFFATI